MNILQILGAAPVMPVLTIEDARKAVPAARALAAGGLFALEITLRTPAALDAVARIAAEVPEAIPGVGTVLKAADFEAAAKAGARFAVSPGATPALLAASRDQPLPYLPAVATASEAMAAAEQGFTVLKFFPAAQAGGPAALKSLAGPLPHIRFNPNGGINAASAPSYLALTNVLSVGGSWVAPMDAIADGDVARIERLAREARAMRG
ncbi:MAG TPA: bifunctional 4-hydroxy-2-oxoglutarate aldolase/2-dehydro-3-deoxy-phosphogluconate aldolase [Caulobacteraceae bacterium]